MAQAPRAHGRQAQALGTDGLSDLGLPTIVVEAEQAGVLYRLVFEAFTRRKMMSLK